MAGLPFLISYFTTGQQIYILHYSGFKVILGSVIGSHLGSVLKRVPVLLPHLPHYCVSLLLPSRAVLMVIPLSGNRYEFGPNSSICAHHSLIQLKCIHRIYWTKVRLAKIKPGIDPLCDHCHQAPADLIHVLVMSIRNFFLAINL